MHISHKILSTFALLIVALLFLAGDAGAELELSAVSHNAIDLRWSIVGVLDPATQRYVITRNGIIIWDGTLPNIYLMRDTGLVYGHVHTYRLIYQEKVFNQWQDRRVDSEAFATPGHIQGEFLVDDVTWPAGYIFRVYDFEISHPHAVTIEPGALVRMTTDSSYIDVYGGLYADGQQTNRITIAGRDVRSIWGTISYYENAKGALNYCDIIDGGQWFQRDERTIRLLGDSQVSISHCTFDFCKGSVYAASTDDCSITDNLFENGLDFPIILHPESKFPFLANNTATNHHDFDGIDVIFGHIEVNSTLYKDLPYMVRGLEVKAGTTLTCTPGTDIAFFDATGRIDVYGQLNAIGDMQSIVQFRPRLPAQGWSSIFLHNQGRATFDYCEFEKGGRWHTYFNTTIKAEQQSRLSLDYCTFTECRNALVFETTQACQINNSSFSDGLDKTIVVLGSMTFPTFSHNEARNNAEFDGVVITTGTLTADNILSGDLPFLLGTLTIPDGKELTIMEGVTIGFDLEMDGINVDGELTINGTPLAPVTFTVYPPKTRWGNIHFDGSKGTLRHAIFRHGGNNPALNNAVLVFEGDAEGLVSNCFFEDNGIEAAVKTLVNSDVVLSHCEFEGNGGGIISNTINDLQVVHTSFTNEDIGVKLIGANFRGYDLGFYTNGRGIESNQTGSCRVNYSTFIGNTEYAIWNENGPGTFDAVNNYWGDASGPTHSLNPGGTGDAVTDFVLYEPWLLPSPTPTETPSPTATGTPYISPTPTETPEPTLTPTVTPTRTPTVRPKYTPEIWVAGYWDTNLQTSRSGHLLIMAMVTDENGLDNIQKVELHFSGVPMGIFLLDDGLSYDGQRGDGLFAFRVLIPPGVEPQQLLLEIAALDKDRLKSERWPYLTVGQ